MVRGRKFGSLNAQCSMSLNAPCSMSLNAPCSMSLNAPCSMSLNSPCRISPLRTCYVPSRIQENVHVMFCIAILISFASMSNVDFKKCPCHHVEGHHFIGPQSPKTYTEHCTASRLPTALPPKVPLHHLLEFCCAPIWLPAALPGALPARVALRYLLGFLSGSAIHWRVRTYPRPRW